MRRTKEVKEIDLTVLDAIDQHKAEAVARKIGVPREVLCGWLIDGRAPKSAIEKMAVIFNRSFDDLVTGSCQLPKKAYARNRRRWERPAADSKQRSFCRISDVEKKRR